MRSNDSNNGQFDSDSGFHYRKNIRNGIFYLALLILISQVVYWFVDFSFSSTTVNKKEWLVFKQKIDSLEQQEKKLSAKKPYAIQKIKPTSKFDPNTLKESQWIDLGFSESQVKTIMSYKESMGGFKTKDDLRKCYVISEKKFKLLETWIDIKPHIRPSEKSRTGALEPHQKKELFFFDPDTLSVSNWEQLGFSLKQAEVIIRYKKAIGGFVNKKQVHKSYVISDDKFREIEPYIQFSRQYTEEPNRKPLESIKKIDINKATVQDIKKVKGIDDIRAKITINYRNSLGGFALVRQITKVYGLQDLPLEQVDKYFYASPSSIKKINLTTASLETLSKHLLISKDQAKGIVNYRKKAEKPSLQDLFQLEEFDSADINVLQNYFHFVGQK